MKAKNSVNVAAKVEQFLQSKIGEKVSSIDILNACALDESKMHAMHQKVYSLIKDGKIKKLKKGLYIPKSSILNGRAKKELATEIQLPAITPQAHERLAQLSEIQAAPPLDLTAILQAQTDATRHLILVEQQNRMLHQALDQIIHILEQCGKIEVNQ